MNENEWVTTVLELLRSHFGKNHPALNALQGANLPYANENLVYQGRGDVIKQCPVKYETDLLIVEIGAGDTWKPRVIIECKVDSLSTHDAITYSEKAFTHKRVHPYLRYGIILGNRKQFPLPGRLFRHGLYFDFMLSWKAYKSSPTELKDFFDIVTKEVQASRDLEEMLYNSRSSSRKKYTILHKPLWLKTAKD